MAAGAKSAANDLALLGGEPLFDAPRHVGRPNAIDVARVESEMRAAFARRWLTNDGPNVRQFEVAVGGVCGGVHCVATSNATTALQIAARALELRGEVIVPAFTFAATASAFKWLGLQPVFCDIDPATLNIDVNSAEQQVSPRTSAVVGVHCFGRECDVAAVESFGRRHGLRVLFDASHAFGCEWPDRSVGAAGDVEIMSFHATKVVYCGEGGAILTKDDRIAASARLLRNFGFSGYDRVVECGINGKMSEMAAIVGLTGVAALPHLRECNHERFRWYSELLRDVDGVRVMTFPETYSANYHYVAITVDEARFGLSRDELARVLIAENVLCRRYFYPGLHRLPMLGAASAGDLGATDRACAETLVLPTGDQMSEADVGRLTDAIRKVSGFSQEIRGAWQPAWDELSGMVVGVPTEGD